MTLLALQSLFKDDLTASMTVIGLQEGDATEIVRTCAYVHYTAFY